MLLYNTLQYNITRKIYKNEYICVLFVSFLRLIYGQIHLHRFKERKLKLDVSIFKIGCFRILI